VDILINNAGIQYRKPMVELELENWQKVIDTNLTSAFLVSRAAAKRMIARRSGGKIINIGSLTSQAARPTVALHGGKRWHQNAHLLDGRRMGAV
jgi:gluconate 5-dehydrogenase